MRTISFSESRANYARTLDSVIDDREEVIVTRSGKESVVIVSLDEYRSLQESAFLLRNPQNAARILRSIERLEAGGGSEHELVE